MWIMWTIRKSNIYFVQLVWFTIKLAGWQKKKRFYLGRQGGGVLQQALNGSEAGWHLEKFQKLLDLRKPITGGLAEQIRIADKGCAILPEKCLGVAVKIIQADGRQDTPAKPIPHHFLAGIDAVDLEIPSDAGQSTRFEPGEKLGI